MIFSVADPGEGARPPPLFLDQTFEIAPTPHPPHPHLRVWMTPPPPLPLSEGLDPPLLMATFLHWHIDWHSQENLNPDKNRQTTVSQILWWHFWKLRGLFVSCVIFSLVWLLVYNWKRDKDWLIWWRKEKIFLSALEWENGWSCMVSQRLYVTFTSFSCTRKDTRLVNLLYWVVSWFSIPVAITLPF